jgi:hypothetical protein
MRTGQILVLILSGLLFATGGCRTFNMTREEFEAECRGEIPHSPEGDAISILGLFLPGGSDNWGDTWATRPDLYRDFRD